MLMMKVVVSVALALTFADSSSPISVSVFGRRFNHTPSRSLTRHHTPLGVRRCTFICTKNLRGESGRCNGIGVGGLGVASRRATYLRPRPRYTTRRRLQTENFTPPVMNQTDVNENDDEDTIRRVLAILEAPPIESEELNQRQAAGMIKDLQLLQEDFQITFQFNDTEMLDLYRDPNYFTRRNFTDEEVQALLPESPPLRPIDRGETIEVVTPETAVADPDSWPRRQALEMEAEVEEQLRGEETLRQLRSYEEKLIPAGPEAVIPVRLALSHNATKNSKPVRRSTIKRRHHDDDEKRDGPTDMSGSPKAEPIQPRSTNNQLASIGSSSFPSPPRSHPAWSPVGENR